MDQGTSLDQLPGGNMDMSGGTSLDQLNNQEEPVYDNYNNHDESDYDDPREHSGNVSKYQVSDANKGMLASLFDGLLGQLKEPLLVAVIVFLINLKPIREVLFNYLPTSSVMVFSLIKSVVSAILFFIVRRFI